MSRNVNQFADYPVKVTVRPDGEVQHVSGFLIQCVSVSLNAGANVVTPAAGKKLRVYARHFSLSADMDSVAFRFGAGGADIDKFISPKSGGLYGKNHHPDYIEGAVNEPLYCDIVGTGTVQVNVSFSED
jgi:hypothetical protein